MDYLPLLIARSTTAGSFTTSLSYEAAFDTREKYGLWLKHSPFTICPKPKNIVSQDWKDQEGEDTYIPDTIKHEAYELEIEFAYVRPDGMADVNISAFLTEIQGRWLKMYDSYTKQGRQGLYFIESGEPTYQRRGDRNVVVFTVKFKVNDPSTNITL